MKKRMLAASAILMVLALLFSGCGASPFDNAKSADMATTEAYAYDYAMPMEPAAEAEEYDYEESGTYDKDSGEISTLTASAIQSANPSEKMIYTAYTEIQTTDFDASIAALQKLVAANGAFIQSSSVNGSSYYNVYYNEKAVRCASYTVRVPADKFAGMQSELDKLGYVTYINADAQNVTAQYTDMESRLTALRTEETRLLELLEKAETVEDIITTESRLSEVRYEIESMTSNLRNLDNQVNYSTLNISISEVAEIVPVETIRTPYGDRIKHAFNSAIDNARDFILDGGVFLVGALPTIVLLAILLIVILLVVKALRRRRKKKMDRRLAKREQKLQGDEPQKSEEPARDEAQD